MTHYQPTLADIYFPKDHGKALQALRKELKIHFVKITDPKVVREIPRPELLEQVSYILGEVLRRYSFILSVEEIRELAIEISSNIRARECAKENEPLA